MANLQTTLAHAHTAVRTIAGDAGLTPSFPGRWPETRQLVDLALSDDADTSALACMELRQRLDHLPVIPIVGHDGRTVVIRQESAAT